MRVYHSRYDSWKQRYQPGTATWRMKTEAGAMVGTDQTQTSLVSRWMKIAGVVAIYW